MWDIAAIGFGLIAGVAIIAIMNQINIFFYPSDGDPIVPATEPVNEPFLDTFFLIGRLISLFSGAFFAGALSRFVRPHLKLKMNLFTGIILIIVGIIDLIMFPYPTWFILASTLLIIPMVFVGDTFIRKTLFRNEKIIT